jgi:hypothetical protein
MLDKLIWFLNRLPDYTYPFGGRRGYKMQDYIYGDEDFFGGGWKIAWWRQVWHLIGGALLSIPLYLFDWPMDVVLVAVAILISYKEYKSNVGSLHKRVLDVVVWVVGALVVGLLL